MSDFKAKMHQIRFRLGSLQRSPEPLSGFKGPYTSKGRGKEGEEWEGDSFGLRSGPPLFADLRPYFDFWAITFIGHIGYIGV